MKFSKKIVIAVILLNVLFTAAAMAVCWHTAQPIDALAVGWESCGRWEKSKEQN